jgi:hypothetical protein
VSWEGLAEQINRKFDVVMERLGSRALDKGLEELTPYIDQARR